MVFSRAHDGRIEVRKSSLNSKNIASSTSQVRDRDFQYERFCRYTSPGSIAARFPFPSTPSKQLYTVRGWPSGKNLASKYFILDESDSHAGFPPRGK